MKFLSLIILLLCCSIAHADDGNFHGSIQATDITASGGSFWGDGSKLTNLSDPAVTVAAATHSITSSCNANGWQISTSHPAMAFYTVGVTTTASIGGASAGSIILKMAPTNSSTAGDWVEAGRSGNSQAITLALTLQSVQIITAPIAVMVPTGYWLCLASNTTSGSPAYNYVSGQEAIV